MTKSLVHLNVPMTELESVQESLNNQFGADNHGVNEYDSQHSLAYLWVEKEGNKFSPEERAALDPYLCSVEYPYED